MYMIHLNQDRLDFFYLQGIQQHVTEITIIKKTMAYQMIIDLILFHFKLKVNRNTISASSQSAQYCYNYKYLCAKITFIH